MSTTFFYLTFAMFLVVVASSHRRPGSARTALERYLQKCHEKRLSSSSSSSSSSSGAFACQLVQAEANAAKAAVVTDQKIGIDDNDNHDDDGSWAEEVVRTHWRTMTAGTSRPLVKRSAFPEDKLFGVPLGFVKELADELTLSNVAFVVDEQKLRGLAPKSLRRLGDELGLPVTILPLSLSEALSGLKAEEGAAAAGGDRMRRAVVVAPSVDGFDFVKAASHQGAVDGGGGGDFWLLFLRRGEPRSEHDFGQMQLDVRTELFACQTDEASEDLMVSEVYRRHPGEPSATVRPWGLWTTTTTGDDLTVVGAPKWVRRRDLTGLEIRIATIHSPPYVYLTTTETADGATVVDSMRGYMADVWQTLSNLFNFTYVGRPTRDGTWGRKQPDGSFNGMFGMMLDGEVQMLVADFYVTSDRATVSEFTVSITHDKSLLVIRSDPESVSWNVLFEPFTASLWYAAVLVGVLAGAVFVLVHLAGKRYFPPWEAEVADYNYIDGVFLVAYAFCLQGLRYVPKRNATFIVFFTIYLTYFVMYEGFEASLFSALTVPKEEEKTAEFLYKETDYIFGAVAGAASEFYLETGNELNRKIYKNRYSAVESAFVGVERVLDEDSGENYGFTFPSANIIELLPEAAKCDVEFVDLGFPFVPLVFYMEKDFQYRELFNYYLTMMIEAGWMARLDTYWDRTPTRSGSGSGAGCAGDSAQVLRLSFDHLWVAFALLFGAWALSVLILLAELAYHHAVGGGAAMRRRQEGAAGEGSGGCGSNGRRRRRRSSVSPLFLDLEVASRRSSSSSLSSARRDF